MSDHNIDPSASERKKDHIDLAFQSRVSDHQLDPRFYYEPLLSGHPNTETNIHTSFVGHELRAPLWVSSMTGGTVLGKKINKNLARASAQFGMGMGLGSCRSLLYDDEYLEDFTVRKEIGDQPLYANLGIAQLEVLIREKQINKIVELLKKLEANGLIIHVNPLQEWLQPEGDRFEHAPLDTIKKIIDNLDTSIIVKEVGQGMGRKSLEALFTLPIDAIDFAANGGTNFAKLELLRSDPSRMEAYQSLSQLGHSAEDMVNISNDVIEELGAKALCKQVIISGGIKDFLDGYYCISKMNCGAIYGQASAFLKYAKEDYSELENYIHSQIEGLKVAKSFLTIRK